MLVVIGLGLFLAGRCGRPQPIPNFNTHGLDSTRTVTESIRVMVRVHDTVTRVRVEHFLDSIPVLIAQVDSAQCSPVILGLTRCRKEMDSVLILADEWKGLALRDSAQVVKERLHADSILDALKHKKLPRLGCMAGASAGYDPFGKTGFTGLGVTCGLRL